MSIAIVCFTSNGAELSKKLSSQLKADIFTLEKHSFDMSKSFKSVKNLMEDIFYKYDSLIFISACGIAVRSIAPYIKSKLTDPAVIVCDELGKYIISLISGHIGGANELAIEVSNITGGLPIITTATDINNKFSIDIWAKKNNLAILESFKIKDISSAILDSLKVGFYTDYNIQGCIPTDLSSKDSSIGVVVSNSLDISPFKNTLHLLPKNLILGIGCKKNTPMDVIENVVLQCLDTLSFSKLSVKKVCSIDLKSNEVGLLDFCKKYNLESDFFSAESLMDLHGDFSKSDFVKSITGVDCVCERSAVLGSNQGELVLKKYSENGVTVAIAKENIILKF